MRLNKTTSHAIRILIDCARADEDLVKVAQLSQRLDITLQNVFKIVHLLNHAGFLFTERGRNGGIRLARPAADIRIGEIVRAIEAMGLELDGQTGGGRQRSAEADVNKVLDHALEAFISVLDQHTLADMAKLPAPTAQQPQPATRGDAGRDEPPTPRQAAVIKKRQAKPRLSVAGSSQR
jgi:Rrf2 family protein